MKEPIILFDDVYFRYNQEFVLEKVSFSMFQGDFLLILGPNGGGKTSLLKLILGFTRPSKGKLLVFGAEPHRNRFKVGYVPQNLTVNAGFPITVRQMVELGGAFTKDLTSGEVKKRTQKWLEKLKLQDVASARFGDISGGQKQKAAVARAMISEPKLLALDEPTNNIDISGKDDFCNFLSQLSQEVTIVMVTHELNFLPQAVNKIGCVEKQVVIHGDLKSLSDTIPTNVPHQHDKEHLCLVDYLAGLNRRSQFDIYKQLMQGGS